MTKLLDRAVAALKNLSDEKQDDVANFVLALAGEDWILTDADRTALAEAEAELSRGEGISVGEMREFWSNYGL